MDGISFQNLFGLYDLNHTIVEKKWSVTWWQQGQKWSEELRRYTPTICSLYLHLIFDLWHLTFDIWTFEHLNIWTFKNLKIWRFEDLKIWKFWRFENLKIWTLDHWSIWALDYWIIGLLEHWNIGTLEQLTFNQHQSASCDLNCIFAV